MKRSKTAREYIDSFTGWKKDKLTALRKILLKTEMEETIKWGTPTYTVNGKNVIGLAGFKDFVSVWFHQGVFLKDSENVLVNAQSGKTKGLRQWRFEEDDDIPEKQFLAYAKEAIKNQKAGKEIKPEKKKFIVPDELKNAMKDDPKLKDAFKALTPGKQREYADHIGGAKQEKTRLNRLEKAIPLILEGIGLHDKYK